MQRLRDIQDACILAKLSKYLGGPEGKTDLAVGGVYTVYRVEFWENCPWYY